MPFLCSICGEESTHICQRCTKDVCGNHLCEKCFRCSDCCECEVALSGTAPSTPPPSARSVIHAAAAAAGPERESEPPPEPGPEPDEFPIGAPEPGAELES